MTLMPTSSPRAHLFRALPVLVTALLIAWTAAVYPFSEYGDTWAIAPALIAAPTVLLLRATLVVRGPHRWREMVYAALHIAAFAVIWIGALMLISKDSF